MEKSKQQNSPQEWQTRLQPVGRTGNPRLSSGRTVMQPTADFFVAGSNPGRANMAAAPPMTVDRQGFEPPIKKSAAGCVTIQPCFVATMPRIPTAWSLLTINIMPWDDIWDDNLGLFYTNDPKKGGYTTPAPALDPTTSVRGDWYFTKGSVTGAPLPDPPPPSPPCKPIVPSPCNPCTYPHPPERGGQPLVTLEHVHPLNLA